MLISITLTLPLLVVFADLVGWMGGALVAVYNREIGLSFPGYFNHLRDIVDVWDVVNGLLKSVVFAGIVGLVACHQGLQTIGGPRGIGRSVTKSVVNSIVLILILLPVIFRFFSARALDIEAADNIMRAGWIITAALVIIEVVRFFYSLMILRSTLYTITNQRVMIERGLLSKALSEINLRYVDDTQFFQGIVDRILGIGNVTIISSDKSTPTYVLMGVKNPRAIREMIRSNSYQVSQRQIFTRAT